ncbi:MAG: hypothetical protein ABIH88_00085 [Patescibacteria group bacterium]
MENIKWSDQIGSRGRRPWLLFVRGDEVIPFDGQDIPGVVVVRGTDYEKAGKWSHTTYRLQLADGIHHIAGRSGWETGRFVEGLGSAVSCATPDTWADTAKALGVSVPSAIEFLRSWRPKAAEKLDKVEQSLIELEEASSQQETDSVIITVSFGSPTNRAIREGFWESPKNIPNCNAEIRLKDREKGWIEENIEVIGISGTILSVKHSSGMHGGYYAVSIAVIPGTETEIPPFETAREKAAKESGVPNQLYHAFNGDVERVKAFMEKVAKLDVSKLDEHEMYCGRARRKAEVIRISGDPDFFLGADPLEVCWYIEENIPQPQTLPATQAWLKPCGEQD